MNNTVTIHEVPPWLRFNRYILTGYRPQMSVDQAVWSLFQWHNESLNIWPHVVGCIIFSYLTWYSHLLAPGLLFQACVASNAFVFAASVMYHLFMPCCHTHQGYLRLLSCDVFGCLLTISTTAMSFIHYGYRCAPESLTITATVLIVAVSASLIAVVYRPTGTAATRVKLFGLLCLLRLSLAVVILWPKLMVYGYLHSFWYHLTSFVVLVAGGLVNGLRFPERFVDRYPWMDYFGNSHNLWHIACIATSSGAVFGCYYDHVEYAAVVC